MPRLTPKQERFVAEFLVDLNATAAAKRAAYSDPSYGRQLLTKPHVRGAIEQAKADRAHRTEITADRVLHELEAIAFFDMRGLATWTGNQLTLTPSEKLTEEQAAAVQSVRARTTKRGTVVELRTHDKIGALRLLADHLGISTRKLWEEAERIGRVTGIDPMELMAEARRLAKVGRP
jgi:phage terminase small subunit